MRYKALVFILFIFSVSCRKENGKEVVAQGCDNIEEPGQYFPGYPNSWWKYFDQNLDTISYSVSSSNKMCNGVCRPVFVNIDKCISGKGFVHNFYAGLGTTATIVSPIYSLTLDSVLICPVSFATLQEQSNFLSSEDIRYRRITTNLDTNILINGTNFLDVIEVYEYDKLTISHRYFDYFAKDIGLIRRDSLDGTDTTIHIPILILDNYFIGN